MGLNVARLRVGVFAVASGESHTHANVSRSARPRFEIVVTRALAGSRSGLSCGPSGGTLGGQRGRAGSGSAMADAERPGLAAHADGTGDVAHAAPGDLSRGRPSPAQTRAPDAAGGVASTLVAGASYIYTHTCAFVSACIHTLRRVDQNVPPSSTQRSYALVLVCM